ncbi:MAG: WG repeat-containing protein [Elusimicrobiota bacterium]
MKPLILCICLLSSYTPVLYAQGTDTPLMPYRFGHLWGYADKAKKVIIRPRFNFAWPFREGLAMVISGGRYNYIGTAGKLISPISYQAAGEFSEGLAPVKLKGAWGYIDKTGRTVIPFEYESAMQVSEGLSGAKKDGRWGVLDITSKRFTPTKYDEIFQFSQGLARVKTGGLYGYIYKTGVEAIPPVYEEAFSFQDGFASARLRVQYGFISLETKSFKAKEFFNIGPYTEGLAHAERQLDASGRCGYIDTEGLEKIPFSYFMCASFSEGLAPVLKPRSGNICKGTVTKACDLQKTKWGFIDKTGKEVIPFKYDQVSGFKNGAAKAVFEGKVFYIDNTGAEYFQK